MGEPQTLTDRSRRKRSCVVRRRERLPDEHVGRGHGHPGAGGWSSGGGGHPELGGGHPGRGGGDMGRGGGHIEGRLLILSGEVVTLRKVTL